MPAVARKSGTDSVITGHSCDAISSTNMGSSTVFVNGIGACRLGDAIMIHTFPVGQSCVPHTAVILEGSSSVFVDGIPIARKADLADMGAISTGSSNVFADGSGGINILMEDGSTFLMEDGTELIGEL
jgi:uncharacterized Zn-binding protein involved in type VI secretion